ncbi:MAG: ParB/RepB/Spo0J family partition protein, partial [Acetobacteraceae bacterium]|nr:ParB/RepB/Spo0J family partition protein [Acetobacteraceae bacterium]
QPLLGRPHPSIQGRYQIIAGERRWRAAQAAGLNEVPALIRAMDDPEALASALVENLQREDLNPLEEAEGFRRLLNEFSMTQEKLAAAVGKSRSHIANTLRLLQLPRSIQDQLKRGALSAGHARALLLHPDPERAAETVLGKGLNVRQTELLASTSRARRTPASDSARPPKNLETAALEEELSMRLGLRVEIKGAGQSGSLRIHYKTLDQLDSILSLLGHAMA